MLFCDDMFNDNSLVSELYINGVPKVVWRTKREILKEDCFDLPKIFGIISEDLNARLGRDGINTDNIDIVFQYQNEDFDGFVNFEIIVLEDVLTLSKEVGVSQDAVLEIFRNVFKFYTKPIDIDSFYISMN